MKKKYYVWSFIVFFLIIFIFIHGCSSHKVLKRYSCEQASQYLRGRAWVDRYPENQKQPFILYYFDDRRPLGIHIRAFSYYKRTSEYFTFRTDSDKIYFQFLHDDRKAETRYTVEQIRPEGRFNLKLTLFSDPQEKGKKCEYYSNTAWSNGEGSLLPEELKEFLNH